MSADKLRERMEALGSTGARALYARWVLHAVRLLKHAPRGHGIDAVEVVNDAYRFIAEGRRGHICPEGGDIEEFMADKVKTAMYRLVKRYRRSLIREVPLEDHVPTVMSATTSGIDRPAQDEMVTYGVHQIRQNLSGRLGDWADRYVDALPELIRTTSTNAEAAELLDVDPKLMSTHRRRLFAGLGYDPITGEFAPGKFTQK